MSAPIVKLSAFRRRKAKAEQAKRDQAAEAGAWLARLDVFRPTQPGGKFRGAVVDVNLAAGLTSVELLEQTAEGLEQIAAALRASARAAV